VEKPLQSATVVADAEGRQYHLQIAPGDLAPHIILVGDPKRARLCASYFDSISFEADNRGYISITGTYQGKLVSVVSVGIGAASTEIALMEIFQVVEKPVLFRVGTSGAVQKYVQSGDFVLSTGALRLENTSTHYVYKGYPSLAHYEVVYRAVEKCKEKGVKYHTGVTACSSSFYAGQDRAIKNFPLRHDHLLQDLERMGIVNMEMESSIVFTLSTLNQSKAGCLCIAVNNRQEDIFIDPELMREKEKEDLLLGLEILLSVEAE
jgi:uridine phosphorylase